MNVTLTTASATTVDLLNLQPGMYPGTWSGRVVEIAGLPVLAAQDSIRGLVRVTLTVNSDHTWSIR